MEENEDVDHRTWPAQDIEGMMALRDGSALYYASQLGFLPTILRLLEVDYIPSAYQPANLFTKALAAPKHQQFCRTIGLHNSYEAPYEEVF
jgi:hypothetical protein